MAKADRRQDFEAAYKSAFELLEFVNLLEITVCGYNEDLHSHQDDYLRSLLIICDALTTGLDQCCDNVNAVRYDLANLYDDLIHYQDSYEETSFHSLVLRIAIGRIAVLSQWCGCEQELDYIKGPSFNERGVRGIRPERLAQCLFAKVAHQWQQAGNVRITVTDYGDDTNTTEGVEYDLPNLELERLQTWLSKEFADACDRWNEAEMSQTSIPHDDMGKARTIQAIADYADEHFDAKPSTRAIQDWIADGSLQSYQRGKLWIFSRSDLEALVKKASRD